MGVVTAVGKGVGTGEGTGVGEGVGSGDGIGVGTAVGEGVGNGVGCAVGTGVGEGAGTCDAISDIIVKGAIGKRRNKEGRAALLLDKPNAGFNTCRHGIR